MKWLPKTLLKVQENMIKVNTKAKEDLESDIRKWDNEGYKPEKKPNDSRWTDLG